MSKRSKSVFVLFVGYVWIATLAGLALHPYRSVKRMVLEKEKRVLLPVVVTPLFALVVFFVFGRIVSYLVELGGFGREVMSFVLGVCLVGLLLWQGLMGVLFVRFWRAR